MRVNRVAEWTRKVYRGAPHVTLAEEIDGGSSVREVPVGWHIMVVTEGAPEHLFVSRQFWLPSTHLSGSHRVSLCCLGEGTSGWMRVLGETEHSLPSLRLL